MAFRCARPTSSSTEPSPSLVLLLAVATSLAVGSQYYNQPLLGLIAHEFQAGAHASLVATATQIGYAVGLVLLVPLGDRMDRKRLILLQCVGLTAALSAASLAPGLYSLATASVLIGLFATIGQQIIPFAAELSSPKSRSRILTVITSALLVGVLLARTLSGFIGAWAGWRTMFMAGAAISIVMAFFLALRLPRSHPHSREPYLGLLRSLFTLYRRHAVLRQATLTQSFNFFGFSAFWTFLTLLLQGPEFELSSSAAGMFGLVALAGVAAAPLIMRFTRKQGAQHAVRLGTTLMAASFLIMMAFVSLGGLSVGTVLMITGLQMAQISNQTVILESAGAARGRFNTVFMASQFAFGAAGSASASLAWETGGWLAVLALASITSLLALCLQIKRYP